MNLKENLLLFAKGMAMGAADVVPGVSGGTIAFITGIYDKLLNSIRSLNGQAIRLLFAFHFKGFWEHINGTFLFFLLAGVGTSILSLSKIILLLLDKQPILVWSFFFGLVLASTWVVGNSIKKWNIITILMGVVGTAIGYFITVATPTQTPEALWFVFLSGAIAICAMILPGISGSFILLLLGKYEYIYGAIHDKKIAIVATFAVGCAAGILSFSHLLKWLLDRYHNATIALLTGFMLGSLNKVWPWKETLEVFVKHKGEANEKVIPLVERNVLPATYEALYQTDACLLYAVLLAIVGFALVYGIEKLSGGIKSK